MTFELINKEFGIDNANRLVSIREINSGDPAIIYATATGGVISEIGITALSPSGSLFCFVDGNYKYYINIVLPSTNGKVDIKWDIINGRLKYESSLAFPSGTVSPVVYSNNKYYINNQEVQLGSGSVDTYVAGGTVNGHRIVAETSTGIVDHLDPTSDSAVWKIVGISNNAANPAESVSIKKEGEMSFSGWNWNGLVFAGLDGTLNSSLDPGANYSIVIGVGNGQDLFVNIQQPVKIN